MDTKSKLTVIIPLYNPNIDRLKRMLQSLVFQPDGLFDIVFVDDCSTDTSYMEEIEKLSLPYEYIKLDENKGQGIARQIGLDNAKNDWVTFVDQDDIVLPMVFQQVLTAIEDSQCMLFYDTANIIANDYDWQTTGEYRIDNSIGLLHGKFYNRHKLKEYGITFHPNLKQAEDTYFCNLVYTKALELSFTEDRVCAFTEEPSYVWFLWKDSTSHKTYNGMTYQEWCFDEFLLAVKDSLLWIEKHTKLEKSFLQTKVICGLTSIYCMFESSLRRNGTMPLKDYCKRYVDWSLKHFDLSVDKIMELIIVSPEIYVDSYKDICLKEGIFIPQLTFKKFILGDYTI